jgi:ATP-dependent exoDNAse (exonuclease V) alpha subunit
MKLTEHQEEVWGSLLSCDNMVTAILGAAGVGKSYSTVITIEKLLKEGNSVAVTGTSHRAVANLKELGLNITITPKTLHSFTGMVMTYDGAGSKLKKKRNHEQEEADYLFIDELSMVTGQLIKEVDKLIEDNVIKKKIIFIGDTVQLLLEDSDPLLGVSCFELTEQLRQVPDESFVNNFSILRDMINHKPKQGNFIYNDKFITTKSHKEFVDIYCEDDKEKLIICFENNTVKTYNKHIQKDIFGLEHYNEGDIIQPTEPIMDSAGNMFVYNRELVRIEDIPSERMLDVPEEIKDSTLEVIIKGKPVLIILTKTKIKKYLQDLADNKQWQLMYSLKESMAEFHHMYASSVHSAQGLSVENVYVDLNDIRKMKQRSENQFHRAFYVAASRARNRVVVFDGSSKDYDRFKKWKKSK